jgi:hypothetical protein
MSEYEIIKVNGLETRTWTLHPEYGYGCAECCNGDRCDEDCTAKYKRSNCPHCGGSGWIKKESVEKVKTYPIGGYAPGNYQCQCCKCGNKFVGDKRAVECEPCAIKDKEAFDALSPEEQDEIVKRNVELVNNLLKNWNQ